MRAILIVLFFSAFTGFQKLSGQQIIAGQQSGPDIVYTNSDDIQLNCDIVNTSHFYSIDIDRDGLNDMMFNASYFYYSHLELRGTSTAITPNNHVQISKVDSFQYSTYQHQVGDTINIGLNWIPSNLATLNSYSSDGFTEYFKGEGYIGFRICLADTIYGWIHALATGNTETASINIYDYAYFAKSNHIDKQEDKPAISCSNPVHDELNIRIREGNNSTEWKCSVYDIMARNLLNKKLREGENHINMSSFENGTYFVIIRKKNGSQNIFKIIKN